MTGPQDSGRVLLPFIRRRGRVFTRWSLLVSFDAPWLQSSLAHAANYHAQTRLLSRLLSSSFTGSLSSSPSLRRSPFVTRRLAGSMCGGKGFVCWLVGCLTSQQQARASQGRICSDKFTCCHTEIEVADQTFYLTQSQYTDTGPTSPSADPITPGAWQGSHWSASF